MNYIEGIIKINFLNKLTSRNPKELETYLNNTVRIKELFLAMGASEKIVNNPACFEKLREIISQVSKSFSENYMLGEEVAGCSFKYIENGFEFENEDFRSQENGKLIFYDTGFLYIKDANIGEVKREIRADIGKKIIADKKITGMRCGDKKYILDVLLFDENGLPVKEKIQQGDNGKIIERELIREGRNITSTKDGTYSWKGNPITLIDNNNKISTNIIRLLQVRDDLSSYLEEIFGKKVMDLIQKMRGQDYGE